MTLTAVAYTRGALTGPKGAHPGWPGRARGGAVESGGAVKRKIAEHATGADFCIVLWRADAAEDKGAVSGTAIDRLLGLQQAVFLVRAHFVKALYVHRREDIPVGQLVLVAAELEAIGSTMIVEGELITDLTQVCDSAELIDLARVGAALREAAASRRDADTDVAAGIEDIGAMDSKVDAMRLVDKLKKEFRLPPPLIIELMKQARYGSGLPVNKQAVHRALAGSPEHAGTASLDQAWGCEPHSWSLERDKITYAFAGIQHATSPKQFVLTEKPADVGLESGTPAQEPRDRRGLRFITTLLRMDCIDELEIPDSRILGSHVVRELLLAEAWAAGVTLKMDGCVVVSAQPWAAENAAVREAAGIAVRFHRALRVHDGATVVVAYEARVAMAIRAALEHRELSDRDLANVLNRSAIPTPSGGGAWSHSQARKWRTA